ncbi:MAG: ATP-grasp domain-containing protein [Bacteroidales bacterium]|nr:ATP-grasp domain-containing protein [Bacteroidales bacterium]MCB8999900.1 ATP-grasp domain-containing protein [Bacteroidales bacterium]
MKKILILINKISENPTEDEMDVLSQAEEVESALKNLGYNTAREFMDLNLENTRQNILNHCPEIVFNLVETIDNKGDLIFLAPALLASMKIPYTGCPLDAMFITSNKTLTKNLLLHNGIRTPEWFGSEGNIDLNPSKTYIAKPLWEDASVGINDSSVFSGSNKSYIKRVREHWGKGFFIEEFIDGREFNISVLGGEKGAQVMPLAEIVFRDFPENKPKIVGYAAKWDQDTFEYKNTIRSFELENTSTKLQSELREMALKCWKIFNLRGYARVDFRVDKDDHPYVLEINSNPCISPDAGFYAACSKAGLTFKEVVKRIIYDAQL